MACKRGLYKIRTGRFIFSSKVDYEKTNISFKLCFYVLTLSVLTLIGCSRKYGSLTEKQSSEMYISENTSQIGETSIEKIKQIEEPTYKIRAKVVEPTITEVDWSGYFEEINGTGVIRSYIEEYEKNLTVCFNLKDPTFNMFLVD